MENAYNSNAYGSFASVYDIFMETVVNFYRMAKIQYFQGLEGL